MAKKNKQSKSRKQRGSSEETKRSSSQLDGSNIGVPDRRVMESMLGKIFHGVGATGDSLDTAQQIMYQAFEAEDFLEKIELADRALEISPDCADAYVLLAEFASSLDDALALLEQGVAAGMRALGKKGFEEYEGHFWGVFETRPYMRARAGLADALWAAGDQESAVEHYQEMLQLNPNDNQGMRYRLVSALLDLERHVELADLLAEYDGDGMAEWSYTRALLAFRQEGESASASHLLREACQSNSHVPAFLTGDTSLPREFPDYISPGQVDEAVAYAAQYLPAWKHSPGAISWLRKTLNVQPAAARQPPPPSWSKVKPILASLPQTDDTWEVDLHAVGDSKEGKMWVMTIADATGGEKFILHVTEDRPKDSDIWQELLQLMLEPDDGDCYRPKCIQVRRKTFFRLWQSKLAQVGVDCQVADSLPRIDCLLEEAMKHDHLFSRTGVASDAHEEIPDIASLPQNSGETWQADVRQLDSWISIGGQPQRPGVILVMNITDDLIYASELIEAAPQPDWLWSGVRQAICEPAVGPPHRPGVIQVDSDEKRQLLAKHLQGTSVRCVVVEQLALLDEMAAALTNHLAGASGPTPMLDSPGVTVDTLGGFFAAAADYYRQAPWRSIAGDAALKVECDSLQSGPWFAVVMGQSGMTLGLALYEDVELLRELFNGHLSDEENSRRTSAISLTYGEAFEISPKDLDAAEQHGWPIAGPEAYPVAMRVNPGVAMRVPLKWELELLRACLESIPRFFNEKQREQVYSTSSTDESLTIKLTWVEDV